MACSVDGYMKRIIFAVLSVVTVSSCDWLAQNGPVAENPVSEEIVQVKDSAIGEIRQAGTDVINEVGGKLDSLCGNVNDTLAAVITSAKKEIQDEVQRKVREELSSKVQSMQVRIDSVSRMGMTAISLGCVAVLLIIILLALLKQRLGKLVESAVEGSHGMKDMRRMCEDVKGLWAKSLTEEDVRRIALECVRSAWSTSASGDSSKTLARVGEDGAEADDHISPKPPVRLLFASESRSKELSRVVDAYEVGASVYQITLANPGANCGEIEPCLDHEDAKRRILKRGTEFLVPICDMTKRKADPTEVVVIEKGRVEKDGSGRWHVTKGIKIEFL